VTKRTANGWYAGLSYTYSKLYGNWDEDYTFGIYNTSSYLEDEPGWNSAEPNRFGRLGMDRPHNLKVLGSVDLLGGTLGGLLRVQSGRAWEAQGNTPSTDFRYLEPAGSRRMPTWVNLDLLAAYTFEMGRSVSLRLEGRVTNVFNTLTPWSVDTVQYLDPYGDGSPPSTLGPQGTSQPNPRFGVYTGWVEPRRAYLTALVTF
jgi:hypothetical protein